MIDEIVDEDLKHIYPELRMEGFEGKSILITGGAGFIGSWLCDTLVNLGARVTCLDNLSTGKIENIDHLTGNKNFSFTNQDVRGLKSDERYDRVFHLASMASPEKYQRHPIETLLANSLGSYNVLELARKNNAIILYTSTSEVYGDAQKIPTPETYWGNVNPVGVRSCYDEGKRFGEALFVAYRREYGLDVRIARIFNTYGPRIRADGLYARAASRFIIQALNSQPITVYGDGSQTRSFCYITDTIRGLLLLSANNMAKAEIVNIGNPNEITILGLAKKVRELARSKSPLVFHPLPKDDPRRRCPDISKAKRILGWKPKISLETGLLTTIAWFARDLQGI